MTLSVSISSNLARIALEVNFTADTGVTAVFGASGAGKTTIINAIAGLHHPDQGRISCGDTVFFDTSKKINLPPQKRRLGYVFQDHRLFPHLTASENLTYGRRARRLRHSHTQFDQIVDLLGLQDLLMRYPVALSGGEKQRVAIGRALLSDPRVLLLDEPMASLDQGRRHEILPYLERLRDHADMPILYVSHSVSEVARLANQVVLLDRGQQQHVGPVSDVFSTPDTAAFMQEGDLGTVLFAKVTGQHSDGVTELAAAGGRLFVPSVQAGVGDVQRVRIKAQDVMLSLTEPKGVSALNILSGEITAITKTNGVLVQIACGSDRLLARITRRSYVALGLKEGQRIYAVIKTVSVARDDVGRG